MKSYYLFAAVHDIAAPRNSWPSLVPIVKPNKEIWEFTSLTDAKIHSILFKQSLGDLSLEIHDTVMPDNLIQDGSHYEAVV